MGHSAVQGHAAIPHAIIASMELSADLQRTIVILLSIAVGSPLTVQMMNTLLMELHATMVRTTVFLANVEFVNWTVRDIGDQVNYNTLCILT